MKTDMNKGMRLTENGVKVVEAVRNDMMHKRQHVISNSSGKTIHNSENRRAE